MTDSYLRRSGFPPPAKKDAKLLQFLQDTVNPFVAHDSTPEGSETRVCAVTCYAVSFINELEGAEDEK